jgi:DNA sulfur modification protein DndB
MESEHQKTVELSPHEGHIVAGVKIDEKRFVGRMQAAQLFQVAVDPRRTEDSRQVEGNSQLQNVRQIRTEVQRLFEGAKRKNVEPYAQYIVNVHDGQEGMAPPIILYSERPLTVREDQSSGAAAIQIPWDLQLVAIDGETQLAARFEAANIKAETKQDFVPVVLCHGCGIQWARQVFHDLNLLAVRPNAALGLSMDERDPLTQIARDVAKQIPFFSNRVNNVRRQLRATDKEVVTFTALRGACVTLAFGIKGVQYGAKPIAVPKDRLPAIERAAVAWFSALAQVVGPAFENRTKTVASGSSVTAALGAMGHELVEISDESARADLCRRLIDRLRGVCWDKGETWNGIAGKFSAKGKFSTSGAKDAAYAVYSALVDENSTSYKQIRPRASIERGEDGCTDITFEGQSSEREMASASS